MNYLSIVFIAVALAMDAFAVSVACAAFLGQLNGRQKFRLSFHFGLFQFFMPLIGWLAGSRIVRYIEAYDHWIALIILTVIGVKMIFDARHEKVKHFSGDMTRGWSLVTLSIATSIDALAVGFSIGIIRDSIMIPAIIIGVVAAVMTLVGIRLGTYLSEKFGQKISIVGGVVLILIGVQIVLKHLEWI